LILWNTLRERNEPDAGICHWMGRVAAVTKVDRLARRLLRRRSVRKKLLGLVTLGQLRDRLEWPRLCQLAQSGHPLLSLAATQAIARIDPAAATETVVSLIVRHLNWPAAKVAGILEDIGPERVSEPFARALLQAPESHRPGLIPFLAVCNYSTALPTVRQILHEPHADEVIASCLHVIGKFGDRQDLPLLYRYLTHPRWHVRAVAAGGVGKMGRRADQEKLAPLLADREWWVRYRAAQAIVGLSPRDDQRLRDIQSTLSDRYARDILTQAIAEGARPGQPGTDLSPTARPTALWKCSPPPTPSSPFPRPTARASRPGRCALSISPPSIHVCGSSTRNRAGGAMPSTPGSTSRITPGSAGWMPIRSCSATV